MKKDSRSSEYTWARRWAALRRFIAEKGMPWAQATEDERGALHRLFRVEGWPTYYLIGKDGTIGANNLRPGDELIRKIEQQFEVK